MRTLIRRWLTPVPNVVAPHRFIDDMTLVDDVLGQCTRPSADDAVLEATIDAGDGNRVPLTFYADEPITDTLLYVRSVVSALKENDARYCRYAAADIRQFYIDLNEGKPPITVDAFAARMHLSHIVVNYPSPEEGANLWYTCDNLIPHALVCVILDHRRRFDGGGLG